MKTEKVIKKDRSYIKMNHKGKCKSNLTKSTLNVNGL